MKESGNELSKLADLQTLGTDCDILTQKLMLLPDQSEEGFIRQNQKKILSKHNPIKEIHYE